MSRLFRQRLHRGLRAVGLDHYQAGAFEQFLGIYSRLLLYEKSGRLDRPRIFSAGFFRPRRLASLLLGGPGLLLALRLKLMDAPLGFDHRRVTDLLLFARTIASIAITSAAAAAAAPLLFAVTILTGLRRLPCGELVKLGGVSTWGGWLLRRLLRGAVLLALRLARLLLWVTILTRAPIRARTPVTIRSTVSAVLSVALLLAVPVLPVPPSFQAALLRAVAAMLVAPAVAPLATIGALLVASTALLVAPRIALTGL